MIYLPYTDFQSSARCLDNQLLGKMRWQVKRGLLNLLFNTEHKWFDEFEQEEKPWLKYEYALSSYGFELCREWILRGNVDTIQASLMDLQQLIDKKFKMPPEPEWMFDEERLVEERKELLASFPSWYGQFWNEEGELR